MTNLYEKKFTNSLADCEAFAKLFHNTCADDAAAVDNVALLESNTQVVCDYTGPNCVDSGTRTTDTEDCSYYRKLCVQCTISGSDDVRIRVQSNGLPINCFYGFDEVVEQNIDFSVLWNPSVDENRVDFLQEFASDSYGDLLCDPQYVENSRGNGLTYQTGSNDVEHATGIALDGVLLFPNLESIDDTTYVDSWTPATKTGSLGSYSTRQIDQCYGSISSTGEYFYMSASECITARIEQASVTGTYDDPKYQLSIGRICPSCEDRMSDLIAKVGGEEVDTTNVAKDIPAGSIIGLAKDGHIIYGPVKSGTNQSNNIQLYNACEIDACNGLKYTAEEKTFYKYVATTSHPYLVGCYGPTKNPTGEVTGQYCTTNQKVCGGALAGANVTLAITLLSAASLSLF